MSRDPTAPRVDELSLRLVDGTITADERAELEARVASDPTALAAHALVLDIEGLLVADGAGPDLRGALAARIEQAREKRMLDAVMPRLVAHRRAQPRRRLRRIVPAGLGGLALAAAAIAVVVWDERSVPEPRAEAPGARAVWSAAAVIGSVSAIRRGAVTALVPGRPLATADGVETAAGAQARLARGAGTEVTIGPEARVAVEGPADEGGLRVDVVALARGGLDAAVGPSERPLAIRTPHAWVTAVGTRFSLVVETRETRLDVGEGRVILRRIHDGGTIEVNAGQRALAVAAEAAERRVTAEGRRAAQPGTGPSSQAFDFEVGDADFDQGHVVRGPACPEGGACIQGTLRPAPPLLKTWMVARTLERSAGMLFSYNQRQVLTFDYWVGADAKTVYVQMWDRDQNQNHSIYLRDPVRERWGHAVVRLADLAPNKFPERRLEEGDALSSVVITAGRVGGRPLYVDNIRLVEWHGPLPTKSSASPPDAAGSPP
jgi:ferric-dicitrate binding protein FerR (iron transport regulator)